MNSQKDIDHANITTEEREDTNGNAQGAAVREKIATPVRVMDEFDWSYRGKKLVECVAATGNHPGARNLVVQFETLEAGDFATVLEQADSDAKSMFEAAYAMYRSERRDDKNWSMYAKYPTIVVLRDQLQEAWDISSERAKLGTISDEAKELLARKVEVYTEALTDDANDDWFGMKNNAQALINQGLQEGAAGIRRALAGSEWEQRARKYGKDDQIDNAINQAEGGRSQKMRGLVQALAIEVIFNTLVTAEHAYPVNFSAERAAREALRFEAFQNQRKFAHPGVAESQDEAAGATNDLLTKEAIGGI